MTFKAKIFIQLLWFDSRLTFANLKRYNDERNSIGNKNRTFEKSKH
jgi:hypothetical protein